MAIPVWPAELPQMPLLDGYSLEPPNLTRRVQPNEGPSITSAKGVLGSDMVTASYHLTQAQAATLRLFLYSTCRSGALRFSWPDPDGGAAKECKVVPLSDRSLYKLTRLSAPGMFHVDLTLEVLP